MAGRNILLNSAAEEEKRHRTKIRDVTRWRERDTERERERFLPTDERTLKCSCDRRNDEQHKKREFYECAFSLTLAVSATEAADSERTNQLERLLAVRLEVVVVGVVVVVVLLTTLAAAAAATQKNATG